MVLKIAPNAKGKVGIMKKHLRVEHAVVRATITIATAIEDHVVVSKEETVIDVMAKEVLIWKEITIAIEIVIIVLVMVF